MDIRSGFIAGVCLLLASCSSAPPKPWVQATQSEIDCTIAIKQQLRDPDSYQMTEMRVREDKADPQAGAALITFRAKNGFGGYGQGTAMCERKKQGTEYVVTANVMSS
jgi:hypothetical protein